MLGFPAAVACASAGEHAASQGMAMQKANDLRTQALLDVPSFLQPARQYQCFLREGRDTLRAWSWSAVTSSI
jgi:hypothetical protein